ncbi:MAG: hypothetical protein LUG12_12940 [Erysipelotrichaceae bacterium]|nr:hypothetical protein [Erysipelotrichaceae bacterium]
MLLNKLIPKSANAILDKEGYFIIQSDGEYSIQTNDSKNIFRSNNVQSIAQWINNYLFDFYTNLSSDELSNMYMEDCLSYRSGMIDLQNITNNPKLDNSIDEIEDIVDQKIKETHREINSRIAIKPFYCYMLDDSIFDGSYPRQYPNKSSRPYLLAGQDENQILWMIPISKAPKSKYENVAKNEPKSILKYSVVKTPCYLLIQNIIPVNFNHVRSRFLYNGDHVYVGNKRICKQVDECSARMLSLIKNDKYYFSKDIKLMYQEQLNELKKQSK